MLDFLHPVLYRTTLCTVAFSGNSLWKYNLPQCISMHPSIRPYKKNYLVISRFVSKKWVGQALGFFFLFFDTGMNMVVKTKI